MDALDNLYNKIVHDLEAAGKTSTYTADANEPDPRYKSYGVRAAGKKEIFREHRGDIRSMEENEQIQLAQQLIQSEFGEQQSIGLFILEPLASHYSPDRFKGLDELIRYLHGWSKIDSFTGSLLRDILIQYPDQFLDMVRSWNQDPDLWLRRASVVLFTRKVARSGKFNDIALEMCDNLKFDQEDLVQKGVGWALKDLMISDRERIIDYVHQLRVQGVSSVITLYAIRNLKDEARTAFFADE